MGILEAIREKREEILRLAAKHGASEVRVFGSVVRGEADSDSDVDFLVTFEQGRSLIDHVALVQDLEDLLGTRVDVVTESAIHWYVKRRIMQEAVPL